MYSPIKAVDHSKNIVRLNSTDNERELFRRRTRSMRRQLETCRETFSSAEHQQNSNSVRNHRFPKAKRAHVNLKICRTESESEVVDRAGREYKDNNRPTKASCENPLSSECDDNEYEQRHAFALKYGSTGNKNYGAGDYENKVNSAVHLEKFDCGTSEVSGYENPILNRPLRRPPVFCSPSSRPKSKKFLSTTPNTSLDHFFVPAKPTSPRKPKRVKPAPSCQIRIEPGPNLEPAKSLEISKYKHMQVSPLPKRNESNDVDLMDSTQHRIKEFLDKTCADAARSRTKIGPAVSLSDLAAIDEQQTSMPILVEGVLAPEERKRQVSKVYPMRTPSPLHHLFGAGGHSTRSSSRVMKTEHLGRLGSPLNLPPIILPPICENKEFQPRQCSYSSSASGEEDQPPSKPKPMTEEDWRSLRKCRYLRIPQSAEQANLMDSVESVFK